MDLDMKIDLSPLLLFFSKGKAWDSPNPGEVYMHVSVEPGQDQTHLRLVTLRSHFLVIERDGKVWDSNNPGAAFATPSGGTRVDKHKLFWKHYWWLFIPLHSFDTLLTNFVDKGLHHEGKDEGSRNASRQTQSQPTNLVLHLLSLEMSHPCGTMMLLLRINHREKRGTELIFIWSSPFDDNWCFMWYKTISKRTNRNATYTPVI